MAGTSFVYQKPANISPTIWRYLVGQGLSTLQRVTPVRTGRLKDGWYIKNLMPDGVEFANDVPYAEYVNDGTPRMAARDMTGRATAAMDGYARASARGPAPPVTTLAKLYPR